MSKFYTDQMIGLKEALFVFECLIYNELPEVYIYLCENEIAVEYFVSGWFLTLYQYDIEDIEQCGLILVLFLHFGPKILHQIAF